MKEFFGKYARFNKFEDPKSASASETETESKKEEKKESKKERKVKKNYHELYDWR